MVNLRFHSVTLTLPDTISSSSLVIGRRIWPSSLLLCQHLDINSESLVQGKRVLDLGSGTGIAAAMAVKCGAESVVMQDLGGEEGIREGQRKVMEVNGIGKGRYSQLGLMWGEAPSDESFEPVDLIVSSDTFYESTRTKNGHTRSHNIGFIEFESLGHSSVSSWCLMPLTTSINPASTSGNLSSLAFNRYNLRISPM